MGRYYRGSINGKFWFGVQASDDGLFFGLNEFDSNIIHYEGDNLEEAKKGVAECKKKLGENLTQLDAFFEANNGYNDGMIQEWWAKEYKKEISMADINEMLVWYARLQLGEEIVTSIEEEGYCEYEAEI